MSGLARDGYSIITGALPVSLINQLLLDSRRSGDNRFERAGIGRASDHHLNRFIRGDQVFWPRDDEPVIREYLAWIEQLRLTLNRRSRVRFRRKLLRLEEQYCGGEIPEWQLQQQATALVAFTRAPGLCSWHFRQETLQRLAVSGHKASTA